MGHDFHGYALEQKVIVIMRQTHLREAFQAICSSGDGRWDRRDGSIFFQWLIWIMNDDNPEEVRPRIHMTVFWGIIGVSSSSEAT